MASLWSSSSLLGLSTVPEFAMWESPLELSIPVRSSMEFVVTLSTLLLSVEGQVLTKSFVVFVADTQSGTAAEHD